jgi:hypothetical protein
MNNVIAKHFLTIVWRAQLCHSGMDRASTVQICLLKWEFITQDLICILKQYLSVCLLSHKSLLLLAYSLYSVTDPGPLWPGLVPYGPRYGSRLWCTKRRESIFPLRIRTLHSKEPFTQSGQLQTPPSWQARDWAESVPERGCEDGRKKTQPKLSVWPN